MNAWWRPLLDRAAPPSTLRRQTLRLAQQIRRLSARGEWSAAAAQLASAWNVFRRTGALFPPPLPIGFPDSYEAWLRTREQPPARCATNLTVSLISRVNDVTLELAVSTIESVLNQSCPNWTLTLVADETSPAWLRRRVKRYARVDFRIRFATSTSAALRDASEDFLGLIDVGDRLAPGMLAAIVQRLDGDPMLDVVYVDEDRLSSDGLRRTDPWFKPDWSPELMWSVNLLQNAVMRRTLVDTLDAPAWATGWDCAERARRIGHVAQVLYHRRKAAAELGADEPTRLALQARLRRRGSSDASVTVTREGLTRISWPPARTRISVVIPTRDRIEVLAPCLRSIFNDPTYRDIDVVLVDTGSRNPATFEYYDTLRPRGVRVIRDHGEPFNYSRANNLGAAAASGDLLLFLNNDTEGLDPGWLHELAGWVALPDVGVVGAKLIRPNGLIQHAGIVIGLGGHGSHIFEDCPEDDTGPFGSPEWVRNYQAVTGACMMTRRSVFDELGGFDELYQLCYSDIDFCLRARAAGYRVVYTPFARVRHHEGASRGYSVPANDVLRASCEMMPAARQGDTYFNPNLSYQHRRPALVESGEPPTSANIVRVLEAYQFVPPGSVERSDDVAASLPQPTRWPEGREKPVAPGRPVRLLLLSHDLSLSGAPLLLACLADRLSHAGYALTVAAAEDGPARPLYEAAGATVLVKPELGHLMIDVSPLAALMPLHDMVIANTLVNWRGVHLARAFGKPSLLWVHEFEYGRQIALAHRPVADAITQADHVVLPVQRLLELYGDFLREGHFTVLPYGLDLSVLEAAEGPIIEPTSRLRVVHVGSVEPRKGQDVLLRALMMLTPDIANRLEVFFVGRILRPDFMASLKTLAGPMANVHFTGEVSRPQALGYVRTADIFVLSSRDEVLPIAVLEAMSFGKPVITTDVGGVREAIESGVNGIVITADDAAPLAEALGDLVEDPVRREALGRAARATFLERYTGDRFAARFLRLVESTLAASLRQAPAELSGRGPQ
jgi:glycosyltransferase involved in cell wall biosynthesis/GT2 family glycosyltransferase